MSMFSFLRTGSSSANVVNSPSPSQPDPKVKSESESGGFFSLAPTSGSSKAEVSTVIEGENVMVNRVSISYFLTSLMFITCRRKQLCVVRRNGSKSNG